MLSILCQILQQKSRPCKLLQIIANNRNDSLKCYVKKSGWQSTINDDVNRQFMSIDIFAADYGQ